jgi:hypothetical protein
MTHIWYEVFPLTLVERRAMLLQDAAHPHGAPWMLPHQASVHPNAVVIEHLTTLLGALVRPEKTIVHSTSWRYDAQRDWMLLTYLAILPQTCWQPYMQSARPLLLTPVGEVAASYGDHLFPPEQIERQHVLAHALDHLAALNTYDTSIQSALEAEWQDILRPRQPRPAGCLQREPLLSSAPSSARSEEERITSPLLALET